MRPLIISVLFCLAGSLSGAAEVTPSAASQLNRTARMIDAGEWAKAEQTLRELIRTHPNNAAYGKGLIKNGCASKGYLTDICAKEASLGRTRAGRRRGFTISRRRGCATIRTSLP
jgi:hypothetical protein